MKRIAGVLILGIIMLGCIGDKESSEITATPEPTDPPDTLNNNESIAWVDTVDVAKETAQNEGKLIFVDFNADFCGWCIKMEEDTYTDSKIIALINEHFVPVFFDLDIEENKTIYEERYHRYVQGSLPTILILEEGGKPLYRIVGYKSSSQLTELLNKALTQTEKSSE